MFGIENLNTKFFKKNSKDSDWGLADHGRWPVNTARADIALKPVRALIFFMLILPCHIYSPIQSKELANLIYLNWF